MSNTPNSRPPLSGRPPLGEPHITTGPPQQPKPQSSGLKARLFGLARALGAARAERKKEQQQDSRGDILRDYAVGARTGMGGIIRLPAFISKRLPQIPEHLQEQYQTTIGFLQIGFLVVAATFLIAVLGTVVLQASVFDPHDGPAVMRALDNPQDVDFSIETVRQREIDGTILRQDQIMGVQMNIPKQRFLINAFGYSEKPFRSAYDGKVWLYRPEEGAVTRLRGKPERSVFNPVLPKDLERYAGRIINDKALVAGERGWEVQLKPSGELIARLMGANLLNLGGSDIKQLRAGKFKTNSAVVSAVRSTRKLDTISYRVTLKNGVVISGLVTYRKQNSGALDNYDINSQVRDDT